MKRQKKCSNCFVFISFHFRTLNQVSKTMDRIHESSTINISLYLSVCNIQIYVQICVPNASMCNILLAETSRRIQCNAMWTCSVHTIKADNNNNNNNNSNSTSNAHNTIEAQHGTARYNRAENSTESNVIGAHSDTKWRKAPTITANSNSNSRKFQQQYDDNKVIGARWPIYNRMNVVKVNQWKLDGEKFTLYDLEKLM